MLRLRGVVLAGLVVVLCGLMAGSASAAFKYSHTGDLEAAGGFGGLGVNSVAVDDGDEKTYVADSGSGAVDVFETSSGTQLVSLDGSLTPAGSFGGGREQVAVAANDATGDVYVLDSTNNVVDVFDSAGGYVCQITGAATPSVSECNGVAGSDTPAHGFSTPGGIAVDQAAGEVFVVDARNGVVDVFSVGGAYFRQVSLAPILSGSTFVNGIAVDDANHRVYLSGALSSSSIFDRVYEFDALSGAYVATWDGGNTPAGSFGGAQASVAADDVIGNVYVTDSEHQVTDVFGPDGEYLTQIAGSASEYGGTGTAVDQATDSVYVSDNRAKRVAVFGPLLIPDVTTGSASSVLPTSVTLNGVVNPDGVPLTECAFEYVSDAALREATGEGYEELLREGFTAEEIFEALSVRGACEHPDTAEISGSSPVAVHAAVVGLLEGVTYHYRLVAENANGANHGAVVEVTPPAPPSIDSASAENVVSGAADLRVVVNPHAGQTSYRFEYGTSIAYGTTVPVPEGSIPAGLGDRTIVQHVSGLQANTTYHWRVVVRNIAGSATGVDHTFVYDTGGEGLPDGRAYEMVTPSNKNGALIGIAFEGGEPQVAEDGMRMTSPSVQCFAGAGSCDANRGLEGDPFAFTRTGSGWVTTALAPPASTVDSNTPRGVSVNTGAALFAAATPPVGEDDFYVRRSDGSLLDIGPVTSPSLGVLNAETTETSATADFSHVFYKLGKSKRWPFDVTIENSSLYEYVGVGNSRPDLVGVTGGSGSTDLISICGTQLGDASRTFRSTSVDGGTVYFTAQACVSGSGVNEGVEVPADTLYARIDEARTVLISGRSPADCTGACLNSPASAAVFQASSDDGSKAFFTSTQQLTDSASEDSHSSDTGTNCSNTTGMNGCNLYEYDFATPAGHNLIAVSAGDTSGGPQVQGVAAVASDGSHVYFVAKGVLTGVANGQGQVAREGAENLYVFERDASYPLGRTAFIADLSQSDEEILIRGIGLSDFEGVGGLANVTPDGRFLVFMSNAHLTSGDSSDEAQVFRYDAQTGELVRISVGERGFNDNGNSGLGGPSIVPGGSKRPDPTMSHDGAYVFFESPVALTPRALNDVQIATLDGQPEYAENVYEWHEGHVHLISDGKDTSSLSPTGGNALPSEGLSSVRLIGSDATGANVFFTTTDRLVGQDTDTEMDYYDARICTVGDPCIPSSTPPPAPCLGEGCRGVPAAPPPLAAPVSTVFSGVGNFAADVKPAVKAKRKTKSQKAKKKRKRKIAGKHRKAKRSVRSTRRGR